MLRECVSHCIVVNCYILVCTVDLVLRLLNSAETNTSSADGNDASAEGNASNDEARRETLADIESLLPQVKDIATTYKKTGTAAAAE